MKTQKDENVKKTKKKLSKKQFILINVLVSAVIVIAVPILVLVLRNHKPRLNWDGFTIANYSDFSAIGAVDFNTGDETATAYAAKSGKSFNTKLAGFISENECREIEFVNKKGKTVKQEAYLVHFDYYKNYSFMTFTTKKNHPFIDRDYYTYSYQLGFDGKNGYMYFDYPNHALDENYFSFILDNKTGKIYSIHEIAKTIAQAVGIYEICIEFSNSTNGTNNNTGYYRSLESEFIFATPKTNNLKYLGVYELSFSNVGMKIVQRMNAVQMKNFNDVDGMSFAFSESKFDKFGNIFSFLKPHYQNTKGEFVNPTFENLKSKGLNVNGIMYATDDNGTHYLNREGVFEKIDFDESLLFLNQYTNVLYREGNDLFLTSVSTTIDFVKLTLDDELEWKYTVQRKTILAERDLYNSPVIRAKGKHVYVLQNEKLYVYNMGSDTTTEIDNKYKFKDLIYSQTYDQVKFKAVDRSTMLEVDGYFDENGEIHIGNFAGVKKGLNRVYVVQPLN